MIACLTTKPRGSEYEIKSLLTLPTRIENDTRTPIFRRFLLKIQVLTVGEVCPLRHLSPAPKRKAPSMGVLLFGR
jgi:hypothetical protein